MNVREDLINEFELNQSLTTYKVVPQYSRIIETMTSPSQEYECAVNCYLIP